MESVIQLPKRDNLYIKDKSVAPYLSVIQKFYCSDNNIVNFIMVDLRPILIPDKILGPLYSSVRFRGVPLYYIYYTVVANVHNIIIA